MAFWRVHKNIENTRSDRNRVLRAQRTQRPKLAKNSKTQTILSENYKETRVIGGRTYKTPLPEKGHKEIFESFISSLSRGSIEMTREEQLSTMRIAINVESELRG